MKRAAIPLGPICHLAAATAPTPGAPTRPNIVPVVADDRGCAEAGSYRREPSVTPNLDRPAARWVRLTGFQADAPERTPTRAALLSGRYRHRVGGLETARGILTTRPADAERPGGLWRAWEEEMSTECRPPVLGTESR